MKTITLLILITSVGIEIDIINALALILGTFYQQFMNNKATYVLSLVLQIGRPNFSELLKIN